MKGLALSNSHEIRQAHNSLARFGSFCRIIRRDSDLSNRPTDVRGALYAAVKSTEVAAKALAVQAKSKSRPSSSHVVKKRKIKSKPSKSKSQQNDAYHFTAYIPAHGHVWELDGLRDEPLDISEIEAGETWLEVVRPALQMKMQRSDVEGSEEIRFTLLAAVDNPYCRASDNFELLKRRRLKIESRIQIEVEDWEKVVWLYLISVHAF